MIFGKPDWLKDADMRVWYASHPDFVNMFKECNITSNSVQCWNMSTLA
jgi:hypothetical protein